MKKQKPEPIDATPFLSRVASRKTVGDLSALFKEYNKAMFNIATSQTYHEIKTAITRKKIDSEEKQLVEQISSLFESLEYSPSKPKQNEIAQIRKVLRELMKLRVLEKKPESKLVLRRRKHVQAEKKARKAKEHIQTNLEKSTKKEMLSAFDSKELREVQRFVLVSADVGIKPADIKKELKGMGFSLPLIDAALSN